MEYQSGIGVLIVVITALIFKVVSAFGGSLPKDVISPELEPIDKEEEDEEGAAAQ